MSFNDIYRLDEFFRQVAEEKCWTAWRTEERRTKSGEVRKTKVPYSEIGVKSESDDPTTWITLEDAGKIAITQGFINGGGGGVELAEESQIGTDEPVSEGLQTDQDAPEWFDNLTLIDPWDTITSPPKFARDMAPASLVNYAVDVAARLGNNPEYVLSAMLAACAGVINDEIVIQPDELDTRWTESARLWGCGVGHSGVGKTPAKNAAMQPIKGVEAAWKQQDDIRHRQWLLDREIYENEYNAWEKAVRDGGTDLPPIEPEEPKYRQIIVDDMSMEALGQDVLADNPQGVLMVYDEMMALIGSLDAYNRGHKDRPLLLDLWNGGPKTINRRGTGRITVRNWGASLFGGIQEDKIAKIAHTL